MQSAVGFHLSRIYGNTGFILNISARRFYSSFMEKEPIYIFVAVLMTTHAGSNSVFVMFNT